MMVIPLALFSQMAGTCAPGVHPETLAAIARTESGFHSGAINDNSAKRRYFPKSFPEAAVIATDLVIVKKHSVDLGLMQINSANLPMLGLTPARAMDPCTSMQAGARVLAAGYRPSQDAREAQANLQQAISRYNTGSPQRGFQNGYVAKVLDSAERIVPAIRLRGAADDASAGQGTPTLTLKQEIPAPPAWDVYAQARHARSVAGTGFARATPTASTGSGSTLSPVQLRPHGLHPITAARGH